MEYWSIAKVHVYKTKSPAMKERGSIARLPMERVSALLDEVALALEEVAVAEDEAELELLPGGPPAPPSPPGPPPIELALATPPSSVRVEADETV